MRIQVVKQGTQKIRVMEPCPYVVECPPEKRK
jgi:hypothetical protein